MRPIKVLIVDDSTFTRYILVKHLETYRDITIVGEANDGHDALKKIPHLKPDIVTLDVEMRHLDGLATLRRIMAECPTPVIMLSSLTHKSAQTTLQALMLGAVDFVPKPDSITDVHEVIEDLVSKIRSAASAHTPRISLPQTEPSLPSPPAKKAPAPFQKGDPVVVIGASAGGPRALQRLLPTLPGDFPAAVVVVQHMPGSFTAAMAQRLNESCALPVQEAATRQPLARGLILIAPGGYHLKFEGSKRVILDEGPKRNGVRPAVDVSMESAAEQHGNSVIGVVLTGMGHDGTSGAWHIKAAGGKIIAEHESSCLIYGMPRSVIEANLADRVVTLDHVMPTLLEMMTWKTKNTRS